MSNEPSAANQSKQLFATAVQRVNSLLDRVSGLATPPISQDALPVQLHFEYLRNVAKADALLYARGYIAKHHNAELSWCGLFPFGEGIILELQDGGSGAAYTPALMQAYAAMQEVRVNPEEDQLTFSAVLATANPRNLLVELSNTGVIALVMPESDKSEATMLTRIGQLEPVRQTGLSQLVRAAALSAMVGLSVFITALVFSSGTHRVELPKPAPVDKALFGLMQQPTPPDQKVTGFKFADGQWHPAYQPVPAEERPSLTVKLQQKAPMQVAPVQEPVIEEDPSNAE